MDGSMTLDDDMIHADDPQPRPDAESGEGQSPDAEADGELAADPPIDEAPLDEAALDDAVPDEAAPDEATVEETGFDEAARPIEIEPHRIVEAILLSTDAPVTAAKIASILGVGTARDARHHIDALNAQYEELGLSFRVESIAGGYQILTLPAYNTWLTKLLRVRQESKLSPAAMETLAIVAYKQPCTRADVESIRGVAAGDGLNRLREMNLVKIVGRAEDLGRPMLYGTTKRFLETFGLPSLEDLPQVEAFKTLAPAEPSEASESPPATEDGDAPAPKGEGKVELAETEVVETDATDAETVDAEAVEAEVAEDENAATASTSDEQAPNLTLVDEDATDTSSQ